LLGALTVVFIMDVGQGALSRHFLIKLHNPSSHMVGGTWQPKLLGIGFFGYSLRPKQIQSLLCY
jgi:hypothetical protein